MSLKWDSDIANSKLSDGEKDGLQIYRNYSVAFENHRRKLFVEAIDKEKIPTEDLEQILSHICTVEPRSIPVIACAFADDQLEAMFRREIPNGVPGGKSELLNGMGSLGRLSQRIQIAYAFDWLSSDVLMELNHLRKLRNDISHNWDVALLESKLTELIDSKQQAIEEQLGGDDRGLPVRFWETLDRIQKLRVRVIWILGRLHFESHLWPKALKRQHDPTTTLYDDPKPELLTRVATLCVAKTQLVIAIPQR